MTTQRVARPLPVEVINTEDKGVFGVQMGDALMTGEQAVRLARHLMAGAVKADTLNIMGGVSQ